MTKELNNFTYFKFPEPTEQTCKVCGTIYIGTRTRLCDNKKCVQWFAWERERNAFKYGPVYSRPSVFYVAMEDYKDIEKWAGTPKETVEEPIKCKTKEEFFAKMIELGQELLKDNKDE